MSVADLDEDDGCMHTFWIRPGFVVLFRLPHDLSRSEAGRLADFVRLLPAEKAPEIEQVVVSTSFKVGDIVEWTSQAGGHSKTKRGRVEMVLPAGIRPGIRGGGMQRDHESYVVRADGHAYWPRVSQVRKVVP